MELLSFDPKHGPAGHDIINYHQLLFKPHDNLLVSESSHSSEVLVRT